MFQAAPTSEGITPAIQLTDNALKHLNKMRSERNEDLCLRIGVKQGGCSGMSYTMEFENRSNTRPDDSVIEYNGFVIGKSSYVLSFSYIKTQSYVIVGMIITLFPSYKFILEYG